MRLALIHYSAPPVIGGVERVVAEQIEVLRENGHHVSLACYDGGEGIRCDSFIPLSREASSTQLETYLGAALSGMDAVFMHNVGTMPFGLELTRALRGLAPKLPATRWIAWVHDLACGNPDYPPLLDGEQQRLLDEACPNWEYVAISEHRANEVTSRLKVRCSIIPNGINLRATLNLCPKISALAERFGWWDAPLTLLHPARIIPRKGIEIGLLLTAELNKQMDVRYLLTGASDPHNKDHLSYEATLRKKCESLGANHRVHFLNDLLPIGPHQLASLYMVADALFFPSLSEGFGLPVLEATAFRLPAFCPDREPLNLLPGAIPFNPSLSISELSDWVIQQTSTLETIKARNRLSKAYRWAAIYRNFLAPLLKQPQT